jgi:class 3 adenylate cyclase/pimeloyl-ACP methyl ester carboxylesterase
VRVPGETRYVRHGDGFVAYQVSGEAPVDLVHIGNFSNHIDAAWDAPFIGPWLRRLSRSFRQILFDQRGTGLSDPVAIAELSSLERWMDTAAVVLDAVGSQRPVVLGVTAGAQLAALFAAMHPQRTRALVLINAAARFTTDDDYPWGLAPEQVEPFVEASASMWGTGEMLNWYAPSAAGDPAVREAFSRYERTAIAPGAFAAFVRMVMASDIRAILGSIQVPTLVLHSRNRYVPVEHGRYLAEHIPGATSVDVPGLDYLPTNPEAIASPIEAFVGGAAPPPATERVLATVMFTDIVESTETAAALGDAQWRTMLDRHDSLVAGLLAEHRGAAVKAMGDGVLAVFDAPARAIRCGRAIVDAMAGLGLRVRVGVHTGEVERRGGDLAGIAVHIGQRVSSLAAPGEVWVSRTVRDLVVGSGFGWDDRGVHRLKGVPDEWQLFAVAGER